MNAMFKSKAVGVGAMLLALFSLNGCAGSGTGSASSTLAAAESSRFQSKNQNLPIDADSTSARVRTLTVTTGPTLTLVASVTPPSVNSTVLQANSASLSGTNVYISYNIAGAAAGGGVDQISVATPALPILQSSMQFPTLDVNNVLYTNGALYVAGNSSVQDSPARLQQYSTTVPGAINALNTDLALTGYAADSVKANALGTTLYAVSGDNAGLQLITASSLALGTYVPLHDARDVSVSTAGNVYVVTGNDLTTGVGQIAAFNSAGTALSSVSIGNTGASQAKSTIQTGLAYGVASAGSGGAKFFCLANMQVLATTSPAIGGETNAAAFLGGFIFTADGEAGVGVWSVNQGTPIVGALSCNAATLTKVGTVNFGTSVSANNVTALGSLLFVSGGAGGFEIITVSLPTLTTGLTTSL